MPLEKGSGNKTRGRNIAEMIRAGFIRLAKQRRRPTVSNGKSRSTRR